MATFHCGFGPGGSPSPSDGEFYAVPCNIVCGESGGSFHPPPNAQDGAYQILPSTWRENGGGKYSATAGSATDLEQHIVANTAWHHHVTWYGNKPAAVCR